MEPETETAKNFRIGIERREVWRQVQAVTRFHRAKMDFVSACEAARDGGIVDVSGFKTASRGENVRQWREALMRKMLTPTPDGAAITWRHMTLAGGQHKHVGMRSEKLERGIAADQAFIDNHPTRRPDPEKVGRRRAFKEAMRQRIRKIAALRDLS
jgi:hypothetical protein